jgi:uncharacterized membrane protein YkoI
MSKPLLLAFVLGIALASAPAEARRDRPPRDSIWQEAPARDRDEQRRISLEQAIAAVQRATGGRVLDAKDMGDLYRIKILTRQGEVRIVHVDARSGAMR